MSTVTMALGAILSATSIIAANSWMQTPDGYKIVNGRFAPTGWTRVIFTPSFVRRWPQILAAVFISTGVLGRSPPRRDGNVDRLGSVAHLRRGVLTGAR